MNPAIRRFLLVLLVGAAACKETLPLRADDAAWFAEVHQGKDINAVRAAIDDILEKDPDWSRGAHGLKARSGGIPCRRIDPERFEVRCEEESREHCQLDFAHKDGGEAIENLSEDEAQQLHAMMLRFCGWREPGDPPPAEKSGEEAAD